MFDARALHGWLGVTTPFAKWIARRVEEYGFEPEADYRTFLSVRSDGKAGRRTRQYLITIDMAKELAMVERTDRGRATRRYFIEMEKAAREMAATLIAQGQPEVVPQAAFDLPSKKAGMGARREATLRYPLR